MNEITSSIICGTSSEKDLCCWLILIKNDGIFLKILVKFRHFMNDFQNAIVSFPDEEKQTCYNGIISI